MSVFIKYLLFLKKIKKGFVLIKISILNYVSEEWMCLIY